MKKIISLIGIIFLLVGCSNGNPTENVNTIRVGASTTPHAEIIKYMIPDLQEQGYDVEVIEFMDYNTPNVALVENDLDINYFQHEPYLNQWLKDANKEGELVGILPVHFEPLGIYSQKYKTLDHMEHAKIAIPNDATNTGRALKLLEDNQIIKLKENIGIHATKNDIVENPYQIELIFMQAENCAKNLQDVDYAIVNGNNALNANINEFVIRRESVDSDAAKVYANILVTTTERKDDPKIQVFKKVFNSDKVSNFIKQNYNDMVIPLVPSNN